MRTLREDPMKLAGEWSASALNFDHAAVERAIAEFRAGRPVLLREETQLALAVGVEAVLDRAFDPDDVADGFSRLVLPPGRLRRLGLERQAAGVISLPKIVPDRI